MSPPTHFDQQLELRDASGATVGIFLPDRVLRDLLAERDSLRQQVAELRLLCRELLVPITAEELADMKQNGIPFEQVVAEVEKVVSGGPAGE